MLNKILHAFAALAGTAAVMSLIAKWPAAVTIVTGAAAAVNAYLAKGPIDHDPDPTNP